MIENILQILSILSVPTPRHLGGCEKFVQFPAFALSSAGMFQSVPTKDVRAVEAQVQKAYLSIFADGNRAFVPETFRQITDCFHGRYEDYQPIDALYHDFEHTMQGTLCMVRLLRCREKTGAAPALTQRMFELGILAILMHDTGYLKLRGDNDGTGAKYTVTHVLRSAEFAAKLLAKKNFSAAEIKSVQNMIRCTGVDATLSNIPFQSELEKITGHALGASDLIGQMAADDYVEKLPVLFIEFQEAAKYSHEKAAAVSMFSSAEDLMKKTPGFWGNYVKKKLERDFGDVHKFMNDSQSGGANWYVDKIESNIGKLRQNLSPAAAK